MWADYWYQNVHKSSGFNSIDDKGHGATYRRFPPALFGLLRMCQPFYDALAAHAIKPPDDPHAKCVPSERGRVQRFVLLDGSTAIDPILHTHTLSMYARPHTTIAAATAGAGR